MPTNDELLLDELPGTFRNSEAIRRISERQLRNLIAHGQITALSRGLYRKNDWLGDEDLIEIASASSVRDNFVLKGAVLLAAFDTRRATKDVDLAGRNLPNSTEAVLELVQAVLGVAHADDGVRQWAAVSEAADFSGMSPAVRAF